MLRPANFFVKKSKISLDLLLLLHYISSNSQN
jgi:hypothetical protein